MVAHVLVLPPDLVSSALERNVVLVLLGSQVPCWSSSWLGSGPSDNMGRHDE
jgi:hypothetical protein